MYRFFFFDEKNLKVKREREVKGNRIWRISWKKWRGRGSMAPIHFFFFFIFSFSREISYMRGRNTLFIFNFSRCDPRSRFFFFPFLLKRNELKNDPFRWRLSVNITPVSFDRGLNPVSITLDDRARLLAKKNLIWRKEIFNQDIPFFFLNYSYYSSGFTRNNKYFLYFVCYKIMNIWFIYICVYIRLYHTKLPILE